MISQIAHQQDEISSRIVEKVAAVAGRDPTTFNPPLYEAIDSDALDAVYASAPAQFRVQFEYAGYLVIVHGDGDVTVEEPAEGADSMDGWSTS